VAEDYKSQFENENDFQAGDDMDFASDAVAERLATGLGWFSLVLGVAEALAPGRVASLAGIPETGRRDATIRAMGIREIAAGIAVLLHPERSGPMWSRVAGDAVDLSLLSAAYNRSSVEPARFIAATAAVAAVTAADIYCATRLAKASSQFDLGEDDDEEGLTEPETLPM